MKKKNYFDGYYYKFQSKDGYIFAFIDAITTEGKILQLVTPNNSYQIKDINSISIDNTNILITFNVNQDDITIIGQIKLFDVIKPYKDLMGYLRHFPIECKHKIVSLRHNINGKLLINNKEIDFNDGLGYIEGDEGRNFPTKYIWMNSIYKNNSFSLAIAKIPFGLFSIKGSFLAINIENKQYLWSTLNGLKIKLISKDKIIVKRHKYKFIVNIYPIEGKPLLAPNKGKMDHFIHEAIKSSCDYILTYKKKTIFKSEKQILSLERVEL